MPALRIVTANVGTLCPRELKIKSITAGSGITTRMVELDAQFHAAGVDIAAVQEARIQGDGIVPCKHFDVYRVGADPLGCDGTQVWLSKELAAEVTATVPISPRLFALSATIRGHLWHIISAHAPIEDADPDLKLQFWDSLDSELTRACKPDTYDRLALCIDANARVGSIQSDSIGPACPSNESENGTVFRTILETHRLRAVNTFIDGSPTWAGSRGHLSRIDYICVPLQHGDAVTHCAICSDIDLTPSSRDDHRALMVSLRSPVAARAHRTASTQCQRQVQTQGLCFRTPRSRRHLPLPHAHPQPRGHAEWRRR